MIHYPSLPLRCPKTLHVFQGEKKKKEKKLSQLIYGNVGEFLFSLPKCHYLIKKRKKIKKKARTLNLSSILPLNMPSYSGRRRGPLLCPLQEPRLKEKDRERKLRGQEDPSSGKKPNQDQRGQKRQNKNQKEEEITCMQTRENTLI